MRKKLKPPVLGPRFDTVTNLYQLKINKITLESDSKFNYYLRKNELQRINERILPMKMKFIVQDETLNSTLELVNVKVLIERIDTQEFILRFEESSEAKRWSSELAMSEYFESRVELLRSRQFSVFDLVIQSAYNDKQCFLIQYSAQIADICNLQIIKLTRKATDAIHKSSESFDSSHFIYLN